MRLAHIVPPAVLEQVEDIIGGYNLLLPSLMVNNAYRRYYDQQDCPERYVIMDNGIAEGAIMSFGHVLDRAKAAHANEVVMPDRIKDMDATLEAGAAAFYQAFELRERFNFMFVPQGTSVVEAYHCAERALSFYPGIIESWGIGRHFLDYDPEARVRLVHMLRNLSPGRKIHLLGTHPKYPYELYFHAKAFQEMGVRGCDTSLAWNATLAGRDLEDMDVPEVPRQGIVQFLNAHPLDEERLSLLRQNITWLNSLLQKSGSLPRS
jgi:hypothetical protein